MSKKKGKYTSVPTDTDRQPPGIATAYFKEDNSVRAKEQEGQVLDHTYNTSITNSVAHHQTRDSIPGEVSYHALLITAKCSSLDTQYSYQDTNNHLTDADIDVISTVGQTPTSQWQMQMHLRPALPITVSSRSPLGVKEDFLHIGAQFYEQSEHNQKEHKIHQ
ncbi:hypothetical protein N431DRAFT_468234 [Stipitochalara longipes BDJ]|nr:hypothetical protein N431DRAFT_468234 [Stipitochalara longipes BDJ]